MRRFFHKKAQQSRSATTASAINGGPANRLRGSPTTLSPSHVTSGLATSTGRVRAPALRSRSMTVLYGPDTDAAAMSGRSKRFSRSLSFSEDQPQGVNLPQHRSKLLTQTEEDEVFRLYTRKLYWMFAVLSAVITGFVVYAYMYNTGRRS